MNKKNYLFYSLIFSSFFMVFCLPLQAWNWFGCGCDCNSLDIMAEARVAYYHPSSSRVRRIYGDGWADYQLEISKDIGCGWRVWAGVSGFSRKGDSIGFHDDTKLQLVPISLGLKYYYPLACNLNVFVGGAACYSFLRIRDHSEYVHEHTRKENWGGLIQSGLSYRFSCWGVVSVFADYFFQDFHFHDSNDRSYYSSASGNSYLGSYGLRYYHDSRFIERHSLNMSGYKVGVGLGVVF